MNLDPIHISTVCLFCGTELRCPENATYSSGDLIKCQQCGEHNDYDSIIEVAKEKGIKQVKKDIEKHLNKKAKGIFGKRR